MEDGETTQSDVNMLPSELLKAGRSILRGSITAETAPDIRQRIIEMLTRDISVVSFVGLFASVSIDAYEPTSAQVSLGGDAESASPVHVLLDAGRAMMSRYSQESDDLAVLQYVKQAVQVALHEDTTA